MNNNDCQPESRKLTGYGRVVVLLLAVAAALLQMVAQWQKLNEPNAAQQRLEAENHERMVNAGRTLEENLRAIHAMQRQHGLQDEQLSMILKQLWRQNHPDEEITPWSFRLGSMKRQHWWQLQRWDIEQLRLATEHALLRESQ